MGGAVDQAVAPKTRLRRAGTRLTTARTMTVTTAGPMKGFNFASMVSSGLEPLSPVCANPRGSAPGACCRIL